MIRVFSKKLYSNNFVERCMCIIEVRIEPYYCYRINKCTQRLEYLAAVRH